MKLKTLLFGLWLVLSSPLLAQSVFVPQVVDGGDQFNPEFSFRTEFFVLNPSDEPVNVTITLTSDDGAPMQRFPGGIAGDQDAEVAFEIMPDGSRSASTSGTRPSTETGWAEIAADGPVDVAVEIRYVRLATAEKIASAGVPMASPLASRRTVGRISSGGRRTTGLAILNPTGEEAAVTLTLIGPDGNPEGQRQLSLPARTKRVQFLNEEGLFTDVDRFSGTLTIESDQPVSVMNIEVENLSWTTFPIFMQDQN